MEKPMPAIFFGHGNPMNALGGNDFTAAWSACSATLSKPRAVLSISAHWYVPGTVVTAMAIPRTIHDFGGFPAELYQVEYPAPGDPELADRIAELLAPLPVEQDHQWGLDHGTWSVLCHRTSKKRGTCQLSGRRLRRGFRFDAGSQGWMRLNQKEN